MQFQLRTLFLVFVVLWASLAAFGAWGVAVFVAVLLAAVCVYHLTSVIFQWILCLLLLGVMLVLLLPAEVDRNYIGYRCCQDHLKRLGVALREYTADYHRLPPACVRNRKGHLIHSWRTLILPYLGCKDIYNQYNFDYPWDNPINKKLLASPPYCYACPNLRGAAHNDFSNYAAVVGCGTAWSDNRPEAMNIAEANTILLVEVAGDGIAWTEPKDVSLDSSNQPLSLGGTFSAHHKLVEHYFYISPTKGMNVLLADGSVRFLPEEMLVPGTYPDLFKIGGFREEYLTAAMNRINWSNCVALAVWLGSTGLLFYLAVRNREVKRIYTPIHLAKEQT